MKYKVGTKLTIKNSKAKTLHEDLLNTIFWSATIFLFLYCMFA